MKWYAAHLISFIECTDGPQKQYPVMEDVVLISAQNDEEAWKRAEEHGRGAEELLASSGVTWNDRQARHRYGGVRRLMSIDDLNSDSPRQKFGNFQNGLEITFSVFTVTTKEEIQKLVENESVSLVYQPGFGENEAI